METVTYENKMDSIIEKPQKRKRGRPRKEVSSPLPLTQEAAPKKRGRPKKDPGIVTLGQPRAKLSREQFWKFQALDAAISIEEDKLQIIDLGLKNLEYQAELLKAKMLHFKGPAADQTRKKIEEAKTAFQTFKDEIEEKIGVSLNGMEIDEVTLEVKPSTSADPKKASS